MFAEKPLYGIKEIAIDDKGRIMLPKFTKRETGDELILLFDSKTSQYKIYNSKRYDEIIDILQKYSLKAINKSDRLKYKKRIYEMCKNVLRTLTVDKQNRVFLGKIFPNSTRRILCTGVSDHLIIKPINEESVQKIK